MGFYADHIAPKVVSCACSVGAIMKERGPVVSQAEGRVLEIGFGSGHNISFYDQSKITHLWGLEPSAGMRKLAAPKLDGLQVPFEFLDLPGEEVPLEDHSVDTVVSTFTFCSIAKLDAAMAQIRRVLKPGGTLLFLEHGLAPDAPIEKWQRRLEPTWKKLADGCHLTRNMCEVVTTAGFTNGDQKQFYLPSLQKPWIPSMLKAASYCYSGNVKLG
jgi:ubiquinone/menaquinone biosynthesis C-methylase UbiE